MKVSIGRNLLLKALTKGSIPALSKTAQEDVTASAPIIKSLKMTVNDKNLTVESSTEEMSVRYSTPKDDEVNIEESGFIVVPAKELVDWVSAQGSEAIIQICLKKLSQPEEVKTETSTFSDDDDETHAKTSIIKIGSVKLVSKSSSGGSKTWELDAFDWSDRQKIDYNDKGKKSFDINLKKFSECMSKISFAADPKDSQHVTDGISIQYHKNKLYFITTDTKRCALYKVPDDIISNTEYTKQILIPNPYVSVICKNMDEDDIVSVYYNENVNKVFVNQKNFNIRLRCTSEENASSFPDVKKLVDKEYEHIADINVPDLLSDLVTASIVNPSSAFFNFVSEKNGNGTLTIKTYSEYGKLKPSMSKTKTQNASKNIKAVWSVQYLIDAIGVMKSDVVSIYSPDNARRSIKMLSKNDDNFIFYSMGIDIPLYANEINKAE